MKFILRWTAVLATLMIFSLSGQVFASSEYTPLTPEMKAQKIEQALFNAADKDGDGVLSAKEARYKDRLATKLNKFSERMDAKIAKREKKGKKTDISKIGWGLILWGIALVLFIVAAAAFTTLTTGGFGAASIFYLLGSLASLAGTVMIIWGLIEMA